MRSGGDRGRLARRQADGPVPAPSGPTRPYPALIGSAALETLRKTRPGWEASRSCGPNGTGRLSRLIELLVVELGLTAACVRHDAEYELRLVSRWTADLWFLVNMHRLVSDRMARGARSNRFGVVLLGVVALPLVWLYWLAVRLTGWTVWSHSP